jgi:hypothetical protein
MTKRLGATESKVSTMMIVTEELGLVNAPDRLRLIVGFAAVVVPPISPSRVGEIWVGKNEN